MRGAPLSTRILSLLLHLTGYKQYINNIVNTYNSSVSIRFALLYCLCTKESRDSVTVLHLPVWYLFQQNPSKLARCWMNLPSSTCVCVYIDSSTSWQIQLHSGHYCCLVLHSALIEYVQCSVKRSPTLILCKLNCEIMTFWKENTHI